MFATLTISGSGARLDPDRVRAQRAHDPLGDDRCSRRSLSLRSSCSPRWSSTAGSELRRVEPASATVATPAPRAAHQQLGAGADEGGLGRAARRSRSRSWELLAQRAEERRRVVCAAGAVTSTSRASTTFSTSPPRDPLDRARRRRASKLAGGRALRISIGAVGCGSSSGSGAVAQRRPAARASPRGDRCGSLARAGDRVDGEKAPAAGAAIESSGRTSSAGGSEDQAPRSRRRRDEGEAADPDRPRARRQVARARVDEPRRAIRPLVSRAASAKRPGPRETTSCALPSAAEREPRGRAAPSRTSGRRRSREAKTRPRRDRSRRPRR